MESRRLVKIPVAWYGIPLREGDLIDRGSNAYTRRSHVHYNVRQPNFHVHTAPLILFSLGIGLLGVAVAAQLMSRRD
jgi:hypothetical protein